MSFRLANLPQRAEGFVATTAMRRASSSGSIASAYRGDCPAHQRVQDQRGRRHPAGSPGRLLPDGIERINIELSMQATSCKLCSTRCMSYLCEGPLPVELHGERLSVDDVIGDRRDANGRSASPRARATLAVPARFARYAGRVTPIAELVPALAARSPVRRPERVPRCCRTTRLRVSWKDPGARTSCCRSSTGEAVQVGWLEGIQWPSHKQVLTRSCVGGPAYARRRRQRAHQPAGQQRTTTRCCRTAHPGGGAHHEARAQRSDGVISGEHGIGITKLEYLEPDAEMAPFVAYKARDRSGRPLQQGQADARGRASVAGGGRRERTPGRPGQCVHAVLRPDGRTSR